MTKIKVATNYGFDEVKADLAFEMYGLKFYIYRPAQDFCWKIIEYTTGRSVSGGITKNKTIATGKKFLKNKGRKEVIDMVKQSPKW